jgi:hypothetical protein
VKPDAPEQPVRFLLEKPDTPDEPVRFLLEKPDTPDEPVRFLLEKPDTPDKPVRFLLEKPDTPDEPVRFLVERPDTPDEPVRFLVERPDAPDQPVRVLIEKPCRPRDGMRPLPKMARSRGEDMPELLVESMLALRMIGTRFAKFLGISDRTLRRWIDGGTRLSPSRLVMLASAVHAKDPGLASRIAAVHGHTLDELGIGLSPDQSVAWEIARAAAEVVDLPPHAMRPALAAALGRARAAGLTIEAAHALFDGQRRAAKKG